MLAALILLAFQIVFFWHWRSPAIRRCRRYASVDAGFIGQNVYLFCVSEGLGTLFRGAVDCPKLARTLQFPDQQFETFAQTVGYARA